MAILINAEVHGQTRQGYDGMLGVLEEALKQSPGFIAHASYPTEGGWRVVEVWNSKAEADQFFAKHVAPNLTPGVRPKRVVHELHSLLTR